MKEQLAIVDGAFFYVAHQYGRSFVYPFAITPRRDCGDLPPAHDLEHLEACTVSPAGVISVFRPSGQCYAGMIDIKEPSLC